MIEHNENIEPFEEDTELSTIMQDISANNSRQQALIDMADIDDDDRFMDEFLKIDHNGTVSGQRQHETPIIPIRPQATTPQQVVQQAMPSAESTIVDLLKRSKKKTWTRTVSIEIPIAQTVTFIRENFPDDVSDDRLIGLVYETISKDGLRDEILRVLKLAYNNKNEKNADSSNNETAAD